MHPEDAVATLVARADAPSAPAVADPAAARAALLAETQPDGTGREAAGVRHLAAMPRLLAALGSVPADIRPHVAFGTPWAQHGLWQPPGIAGLTLTPGQLVAALRRHLAGDSAGRLTAFAGALLDAAAIPAPASPHALTWTLTPGVDAGDPAGRPPTLYLHGVADGGRPVLTLTLALAMDGYPRPGLPPAEGTPDHHAAVAVSPAGALTDGAPGWRETAWGQVLAAWESRLARSRAPDVASTPAFHRLRGILWRRTLRAARTPDPARTRTPDGDAR